METMEHSGRLRSCSTTSVCASTMAPASLTTALSARSTACLFFRLGRIGRLLRVFHASSHQR
ncbi:hypothetical protein JOS77_22670 [Chromobacterium haemolyticum]|nr:hypothetical protein JOS77_22670 [Chromobacterium haemolyticum]